MKRFYAALILAMFTFVPAVGAQIDENYVSPELVRLKTPLYKVDLSSLEPRLGKYNYKVSWEGIPAAYITATIEQIAQKFRLKAEVRTYRGIDLFYKLRYFASGEVSAFDLSPIKSSIQQQENSRKRFIEINFEEGGDVEAVSVDQTRNEVTTIRFDPQNFMLDPFGAAFLAKSLPWQKGETKEFDTFNGKSRYLITLTAQERTQLDINNETRDVWVIVPKVKNLSFPENSEKLRQAKIYLSADNSRDILKIVSSVFVGRVTTELVSFEPADKRL